MPTTTKVVGSGNHPNSRKNLEENKGRFKNDRAAAKAAGKKGGDVTNEEIRAYKTLRERLRNRLTENPELEEQILDVIVDGVVKHKNYNAFDRLLRVLGEDTSQVEVSVSGGIEDALKEFNGRDRKVERG